MTNYTNTEGKFNKSEKKKEITSMIFNQTINCQQLKLKNCKMKQLVI